MRHFPSAFGVALWFCFLAFPLVGMQVDYLEKTLQIRWGNLGWVLAISFVGSLLWQRAMRNKSANLPRPRRFAKQVGQVRQFALAALSPKGLVFFLGLLLILPWVSNSYQVGILLTAMIYITLGLGLNVVVGMAGLLDLGFVAFYAVGAYTYALINLHWGWGFWSLLPLAGSFAAVAGVALGFPVLRLRGDYLAIVTLGFGEILRLLLENEEEITQGPSGIPGIPRPDFFGVELTLDQGQLYLYLIALSCLMLAILVNKRLQTSKMGRAWMAIRDNEIAAQAMGIDRVQAKLTAFSIGAFWAGLMGAIFAAKASFINPASFTFHESAIILSIVVLGGMGSVLGVILASLILVLLPEYLRFLEDYRMLIFGGILVVMMIFRPQGLIGNTRPLYQMEQEHDSP